MENKEYKTNLIAGLPIEIIDLCKVYPLHYVKLAR